MTIKKKGNLLLNPWLIGIGSSVFGVLSIRIIDYLTGSIILPTIWNFIIFIFNNVITFVNLEFHWKLYALISLFLSGPLIGLFVIWIISEIQDSKSAPTPEWLMYRKDNFDGVIYKWDYEKDYNDKYEVSNLTAYCSNCECQLVDQRCPNCKSEFHSQLRPSYEIVPLIIHRIETKKPQATTS